VVVGDKEGQDKITPGVKNILLIIGPEGGFSTQEVENFRKNQARLVSFSTHRLRSETAAIAGIVTISSYYSQ
jgi:16S rRNA (uracil1498-N3)-methyltransferase